MKHQENNLLSMLKNFFQKLVVLFKNFKPIPLKDKLFEVPDIYRKLRFKANCITSISDIIFMAFSFLLLITNILLENGIPYFALAIFMLHHSRNVLANLIQSIDELLRSESELFHEDSIAVKGSEIIEKVSQKIYTNSESNFLRLKSNEEITNSISRYLSSFWKAKTQFPFYIIELASVIVLLIMSVVSNTTIPQYIFIPLIIIYTVIELLSSSFKFLEDRVHWKKRRELNDQKHIIKNDIMRVPHIVKQDLSSRVERLKKLSHSNYENERDLIKLKNKISIIAASLDTILLYVLIITFVLNVGEFTTTTVVNLTATLAIFKTTQNRISRFVRIFYDYSETMISIEKENESIDQILERYYIEVEREKHMKHLTNLFISSFEIMYQEKSDNDKSFRLILKNNMNFKLGDVIFLAGPSGAGKSTFLKVVTGNILIDEKSKINLQNFNYLLYDETLYFGSRNIYDEIFCIDSEIDDISKEEKEKLKYIMENLHLWQEIEENCHDVWKWFKENTFKASLSNGQRQRLILSKILYWLDETIDIVALDECTSGLDTQDDGENSATALNVLKFIINYCNADRKRLVLVSSHQEIGSLCNRELYFSRNNGITPIKIVR